MNIQLIAEGSTKWQRTIRRWGISFLIGEDVLFDTFGDVRVFERNVRRYKIDLSKIRHVIISHDDWDHIAGLWGVIDRYKDITVYVGPHFNKDLKDRIRTSGVKLVEAPDPVMIREGVYTTGELSGGSPRGMLYEHSVVIKNNDYLAVVTGCAHPHLVDILKAAREAYHLPIDLLIGGFHLKDMDPEKIREIVEALPAFGVRRVVPLHCTGKAAVREFEEFYLKNTIFLKEGGIIEV